jgi:hypothetical protein
VFQGSVSSGYNQLSDLLGGAIMVEKLGAYWSPDEVPRTRTSVCAYFDVLGFTGEVRRAEGEGTSNELLGRFRNVATNWFVTLGDMFALDANEPRRREFKTFTDNVVVGSPLEMGGHATELSFVLSDIGLLQIGLVMEGFFVRGGTSIGALYIDEQVVYGSALLDAYECEQAAVSPRVILHSTAQTVVAHEAGLHYSMYGERRGHRFTDELLRDEDGKWFINYLHDRFTSGGFDGPDYSTLQAHHDVVAERLAQFGANEHIRAKYLWVARYHNYFCDTYAPDIEDSARFDVAPLRAAQLEDAAEAF